MKASTPSEVAVHEASHAVVAERFGHDGGKLSIVPKDGILGWAQTEAAWGDGSLDREQIVVLFAGHVAERVLFPESDVRGAAGDEEAAAELLRFQPEGSEAELRVQAARLVQENWQQILAVATALTEEQMLSWDEWTLIISAVDEGKDWRAIVQQFRQIVPDKAMGGGKNVS